MNKKIINLTKLYKNILFEYKSNNKVMYSSIYNKKFSNVSSIFGLKFVN